MEKLIEATFEETAELNSTLKQRVHTTWNILRMYTEHNLSYDFVMEAVIKHNMQERFKVKNTKK